MKQKQLDNVHTLVCQLCATLRDDTVSLTRLSDLLDCVIELARTGHTIEAIAINREVMSFLAEGHSRSVHDARQKAWADSMRTATYTPPVANAYTQVKCEPPRPVATVEQMRAAADAAMAHDEEMDEYKCDSFGRKHEDHIGWFVCNGCGQRTATADGKKPLGWVFNDQIDGKVYKALCPPCFGTGIPQKYVCEWCNSTTESRVFPPPGWKESDDNEVICFACAEEEAKP